VNYADSSPLLRLKVDVFAEHHPPGRVSVPCAVAHQRSTDPQDLPQDHDGLGPLSDDGSAPRTLDADFGNGQGCQTQPQVTCFSRKCLISQDDIMVCSFGPTLSVEGHGMAEVAMASCNGFWLMSVSLRAAESRRHGCGASQGKYQTHAAPNNPRNTFKLS